jgi:heat shock protein HslJ
VPAVITRLRLLLVVLLAAGTVGACDTGQSSQPTLENTAWRALTVVGQSTIPGSEPTASFTGTEVAGSSGCNSYSSSYTYDASTGTIFFGPLASTLMLCAEPAKNATEAAFNGALASATSATIDELGHLIVNGPGGMVRFAPVVGP